MAIIGQVKPSLILASGETRPVRPVGHEWRQREAPDELLNQGHRRIEISLEDSGNGLPLGSLPRSFGSEFTKRSSTRSGHGGEMDREGSVLYMGANSEPAADPGAC